MKLMMAAELGSTAEAEMSWFQALSAEKERKPFRLAPWPRLIELQVLELPAPPPPVPPPPPLPCCSRSARLRRCSRRPAAAGAE
jgi:hypothetical protein